MECVLALEIKQQNGQPIPSFMAVDTLGRLMSVLAT